MVAITLGQFNAVQTLTHGLIATVDGLVFLFILRHAYGRRTNKKSLILYASVMFVCACFVLQISQALKNDLLKFFVPPVVVYLTMREPFKRTISITAYWFLAEILVGGLHAIVIQLIFPDYVNNPDYVRYTLSCAVAALNVYWVAYCLVKLVRKRFLTGLLKKHHEIIILVIILLNIFATTLLISIFEIAASWEMRVPVMISVVIFAVLIAYSQYLVVLSRRRAEQLGQYQTLLENQYDTISDFRHNYKNTIAILSGLSEAGQHDRLAEYIQSLAEEHGKILNESYIGALRAIHDEALKALMIAKVNLAYGMSVSLSVSADDPMGYPAKKEFYELVGILLDNALEAAALSDDKTAAFTFEAPDGQKQIRIVNSFGAPPDIQSIFAKGYSTKPSHTGIGLYRAQKILDANDSWQLICEVVNGRFVATLRC